MVLFSLSLPSLARTLIIYKCQKRGTDTLHISVQRLWQAGHYPSAKVQTIFELTKEIAKKVPFLPMCQSGGFGTVLAE